MRPESTPDVEGIFSKHLPMILCLTWLQIDPSKIMATKLQLLRFSSFWWKIVYDSQDAHHKQCEMCFHETQSDFSNLMISYSCELNFEGITYNPMFMRVLRRWT